MITSQASVTSAPIRPNASEIARFHLENLLRRHPLTWLGLPAALFVAAAATSDWRWLIASLASLFILLPMALAFAWLRALPSAASALRPYTLSFRPSVRLSKSSTASPIATTQQITIQPLPFPHEQEQDINLSSPPSLTPWTITHADITRATLTNRSTLLAIELRSGLPASLLLIPMQALPSPESRRSFISAFIPEIDEIL